MTYSITVFLYNSVAEITVNIADSEVCPGEELVYTCVSIGTSQRWQVQLRSGTSLQNIFFSGDSIGSVQLQGDSFTFRLISTSYNHFESTMTVMASASLDNAIMECTGLTAPDTLTIHIAG